MISVDGDLPTRISTAHDEMHLARRDGDSDAEWDRMEVTDHLLDALVTELKANGQLPALEPELDAHLTVIENPKLVRLSQVRAAR
ncbi:hypothetical protein [Mycolicibacterium houstonense]|uniref:hypothetical protein n=1 Tax=Mycolicibacterium houstonense TaxID=146021 RepID=UPI001C6596DF|nr:hypothetical protein [Mycolicibacterium houstonense]